MRDRLALSGFLLLAAVAVAGSSRSAHITRRWIGLLFPLLLAGCGGFETSTTPAVQGHADGLVYVAAVTLDGNIFYRTLESPEASTSWEHVSTSARGMFHPETGPLLLHVDDRLYLFARGADNNLWRTMRRVSGDWADWIPLTDTGDVLGRFDVAVTESPGGIVSPTALEIRFHPTRLSRHGFGGSTEFHVIHVSGEASVRYRVFSNATALGAGFTWTDAVEGTIGSDGADQVVAALRRGDRMDVHEAQRGAGWGMQAASSLAAPRGTLDLSNVVHFRDQYHFLYVLNVLGDDVANDIRAQIRHARFTAAPEGPDLKSYAFERSIDPRREAWPVLVDYRNKLMAVYLSGGGLHYARWDNANGLEDSGNFAWVGRIQAGGSTFVRPGVGRFTPALSMSDQLVPNYGDDVFVAIKFPSPPFDQGEVRIRDFSQSIFRKEIDREYALFYDEDDIGCTAAKTDPLERIFMATEQRPYITELGFLLWTLPSWVSQGGLRQVAEDLCANGQWTESNTGGRVKPPCDEANLPIILKPSNNIYVCQGVWNQVSDPYLDLWQEVGHYVVGQFFGLSDAGSVAPTSLALPPNGPSLAAYTEAAALFGARVGANCANSTMDGAGRCRGFTGFANNYDSGSIQHSFIYVWYFYFVDGDRLRGFVAADLAVGDDLLNRKYNWIRDHIYRGEEFRTHNEPVTNE